MNGNRGIIDGDIPLRFYVDFVRRNAGGVLAPSLSRVLPKIDLDAISAFIANVPLISDLQREVLWTLLMTRYGALFVWK